MGVEGEGFSWEKKDAIMLYLAVLEVDRVLHQRERWDSCGLSCGGGLSLLYLAVLKEDVGWEGSVAPPCCVNRLLC